MAALYLGISQQCHVAIDLSRIVAGANQVFVLVSILATHTGSNKGRAEGGMDQANSASVVVQHVNRESPWWAPRRPGRSSSSSATFAARRSPCSSWTLCGGATTGWSPC